jgi:hypothetical protein
MLTLFWGDLSAGVLAMILPVMGAWLGSRRAPVVKRRLPFLVGVAFGVVLIFSPPLLMAVCISPTDHVNPVTFWDFLTAPYVGGLTAIGLFLLYSGAAAVGALVAAFATTFLQKPVEESSGLSSRPRLRFSLKQLLVVTAVIVVFLSGWRFVRDRDLDYLRECAEVAAPWERFGWTVKCDYRTKVLWLNFPATGAPPTVPPVTDDVVRELASSHDLNSLRRIDLKGTQVTDTGLLYLSRLRYLSHVDVRDTAVTEQGVEEFWERHVRHGRCTVWRR